jgi:hypothetical protein
MGSSFGHRLFSFINPCSLSDGHLPRTAMFAEVSSAFATEAQEIMA